PPFAIVDSVMRGRERRRGPLLDRRGAEPRVRAALAELGRPDLAPGRRVDSLSPGERQLVEIARALAFSARVLVMDEPTSSLSRADAERLFSVIERLRARGGAAVYGSHRLEGAARRARRFT